MTREPRGEIVSQAGESWYRIRDYDGMPPFFMTLAGDSDHWLFVTSRGGLTAGRVDPEGGLFPYETVDRLMVSHLHTGPITLLAITTPSGNEVRWEPFADTPDGDAPIRRTLAKNIPGTLLQFEEEREDLGLGFRYRWGTSDAFGCVRTATLTNRGAAAVRITLLDGLRNVLPAGAPLALQQQASCLIDAYTHTEVDGVTRLGIFSLTAGISDRPEPEEQLIANVVWCRGLPEFEVHLSTDVIADFRAGRRPQAEPLVTGRRGSYLVSAGLELAPGASVTWHLVADVRRSQVEVAGLRRRLASDPGIAEAVEESLREAGLNLRGRVAASDGIQATGDPVAGPHHFANVLFNIMRGGVPVAGYQLPVADLRKFLALRHRPAARRQEARLAEWPQEITLLELQSLARASGDVDFERLAHEYLPLTFGRRHGDPSRPWNRFSIRLRDTDGARLLWYEGNWRDIFQNWEALALSFPAILPGLVAKFVNASTVDGFNPYRISRNGIDWEVIEEGDTWSNIGYWGDHQVVYLLRLLEALQRYDPGRLGEMLHRPAFSYADVPYRLRSYPEIVHDPDHTIDYDPAWAARIAERVEAMGTDGRLRPGPEGGVLHVTLLEKLLVTVLARLSHLVVGGGIWMNTQRPEWNDANNALVGNGLSVVTVCHLRRFLEFLIGLLGADADPAPVSREVVTWSGRVQALLAEGRESLDRGDFNDRERARLLDALGQAFADYRTHVYDRSFSGVEPLTPGAVADLCRTALPWLDHTIRVNRREDGLYHAYNLRVPAGDGASLGVRHLYEMLEGQVAALSSGLITPEAAVGVIDSLFASRLYRPDQASFLLYPARVLPRFLERNGVPEGPVRDIGLLAALQAAGRTDLVERDAEGTFRFRPEFRNARHLAAALDRLATEPEWEGPVARDRGGVLELYESVFHHRAFTGRSGTMYGYEGLGCIYWHMVAKLMLAVQELFRRAEREGAPDAVREALAAGYERIQAGLGYRKAPAQYGAFPLDPYSHTPAHAGAQQPGMTGQVKEEVLTRWGELGLDVTDGRLHFRPRLLHVREFSERPHSLHLVGQDGAMRALDLPAETLAFTVCQTPVVYQIVEGTTRVRILRADGRVDVHAGDGLDAGESRAVFERSGNVARIEVGIPRGLLRGV